MPSYYHLVTLSACCSITKQLLWGKVEALRSGTNARLNRLEEAIHKPTPDDFQE